MPIVSSVEAGAAVALVVAVPVALAVVAAVVPVAAVACPALVYPDFGPGFPVLAF